MKQRAALHIGIVAARVNRAGKIHLPFDQFDGRAAVHLRAVFAAAVNRAGE